MCCFRIAFLKSLSILPMQKSILGLLLEFHLLIHVSLVTKTFVGAPQMPLQQYISSCPCLESQKPILVNFQYCRIVFAIQQELEMWPCILNFRFFIMIRRSACAPVEYRILLRVFTFEPRHDKPNKMACAHSEDSDQPGHPPSLVSLRCPHEETLGP